MEEEKSQYVVGAGSESPQYGDHSIKHVVQNKGAATGEAADLYGDLATAEQYGYVERGYVFHVSQMFGVECRTDLGPV